MIVITTKRGHTERPVINFRMQIGFSDIADGQWNLMNTAERIQYEKEIGLDAGKDYDVLSQTDVNWMDEVFNDAAMLQNYELSVSGSSEKTSYFVSGAYYDQEGIAMGSGFSRYSIRANVEQRAASWLTIGTNTMLNYQEIEQAEDGQPSVITPISAAQFTVDYSHTTGFGKSYPEYAPNLGEGYAQRSSTDGLSLSVTNTVGYTFDIDHEHTFNFMIGQEGVDYHYESFALLAEGQNNNKLTDITNGARVTQWQDTTNDDYGFLSFFGRAEYNYLDRYYVDASARADASSRFGSAGRWAGFWSLGLMWNMRNEKFMENTRHWLTFAQISLSTGTSGNSTIPNYEHLALVGGSGDYVGTPGLV